MSVLASQFGRPHGALGRLVGSFFAHYNARFNRWIVRELRSEWHDEPARIVELGPGPGLGLEETLREFPSTRVWGIDRSQEMLTRSGRRNRQEVATGRLVLLEGDCASLSGLAPVDMVFAVHVLYFWHQPSEQLAQIRRALRPGGRLALGFRLRCEMPFVAQTTFPKAGHLLYESEDQLSELLRDVGFTSFRYLLRGSAAAPKGRLVIAVA